MQKRYFMARTRKDGKNYGKHNIYYRESGRGLPYDQYDLGGKCSENGKPSGWEDFPYGRARKFLKRRVTRARRKVSKRLLAEELHDHLNGGCS